MQLWPHSLVLLECLFLLSPFCCGGLFRYKKGLQEALQQQTMFLVYYLRYAKSSFLIEKYPSQVNQGRVLFFSALTTTPTEEAGTTGFLPGKKKSVSEFFWITLMRITRLSEIKVKQIIFFGEDVQFFPRARWFWSILQKYRYIC
jgi:hypothetical protein